MLRQHPPPAAVTGNSTSATAALASVSGLPIDAMVSGEGEDVALHRVIKIRGQVEEWLVMLEETMKQTVQKVTKAGLLDYGARKRTSWILCHPAQVPGVGVRVSPARRIVWFFVCLCVCDCCIRVARRVGLGCVAMVCPM